MGPPAPSAPPPLSLPASPAQAPCPSPVTAPQDLCWSGSSAVSDTGKYGAAGGAHGRRPGPLPPPLPSPILPVCRQNLSYSPVSEVRRLWFRRVKWLIFVVSHEVAQIVLHSFGNRGGQPRAGHWLQRRTSQALPPGRGNWCPERCCPERTPNPTSWRGKSRGLLGGGSRHHG